MQPQRKHDEIEPEIRPRLGVIQGGGETSDPHQGHLSSVPESTEHDAAESGHTGRHLQALEGGGETSDPVRGHLKAVDSGADLGSQEADTADDNSMNFHREDKKKKKAKTKGGFWNKKRAGAAGIISGVLVGGAMVGIPATVGPMEFIHLAHRLHDNHFSQQEDAGNSRMSKFYRFIRSGGRAGETRIGWIASKYHAKIIGQLNAIGITPQYGGLDTYKGFTIDTDHEKSPYKGMTPDEAAKEFERKTGIKPTIGADGKLTVDSKGFWDQRKSLRAALNELGTKGTTTALRTRVLAKFGMVTWKPLEILDKKLNNSALFKYFEEKWKNRLSNGDKFKVSVKTSGATQDGVDENGKPTSTPLDPDAATAAQNAPKNTKSTLDALRSSNGLKITGGVAAAAGSVCVLQAIDDHVGEIRYQERILPVTRLGMNMMTSGYQASGGVDSTGKELGYLHGYMNSADSKVSDTYTGNWSHAASLKASAGQTDGIDLDQETKDTLKDGRLPWLQWTHNTAFDAMCSTGGAIVLGGLSIGIGVLTGGIITTIVGAAVGAVLTDKAIQAAGDLASGEPMDLSQKAIAGTTFGNYSNYGAFYGSRAAATQFGGVPLSTRQSMVLKEKAAENNRDDFAQQSFLARTFDPKDYRSLVGSAIDSSGIGNGVNVTDATRNIATLVRSAAKIPASIYSSSVHAAAIPYNFGYPDIGFSDEDQNRAEVQDPFANADEVAAMLNGPNGSGYISKAEDCFGVSIAKQGESGWGVVTTTDVNTYDTEKYSQLGCGDSSLEWLRIRFFIFDTGVVEGYACLKLDDVQSCKNSGTGISGDSTGSTNGATATASDNVDYNACNAVATGKGKIVCSAYLFDKLTYLYGAPARGDWGFLACVKSNFAGDCNGKYSSKTVDCSTLVTYAIYDAMGWDVKAYDTASMGSSPWFTKISDEDAQPGDILLTPGSHTEIIVSNDKAGRKFNTYGAHTHYSDNPEKDVSPSAYNYGSMQAYRVNQP